MKLPFVSRFAYDEMKVSLTLRAERAEADREKMLNKILRLSVGSDGEQEAEEEEPEIEEAEPIELTDMQKAIQMAGGSKRPSIIRRCLEQVNAQKRKPSRMTAVNDMARAFDEGVG